MLGDWEKNILGVQIVRFRGPITACGVEQMLCLWLTQKIQNLQGVVMDYLHLR
jgi:hypothetical protein